MLARIPFRTLFLVAVLLGASCFAAPSPARAQEARTSSDGEETLGAVSAAFAAGDVARLLGHTAERLDVTLFGASALYSRAQAAYVLQDFFRTYPPTTFSFGVPARAEDNWFVAGTYQHAPDEEAFAVYVRLRKRQARWEVREIRIARR